MFHLKDMNNWIASKLKSHRDEELKELTNRFMTVRYPVLKEDGFHCPLCDMRLETKMIDSIRCHYCGTLLKSKDFDPKLLNK